MKKPKLKWEKSGRSFIAYAGRLSLAVRRNKVTGSRSYDPGWHVRGVFGDIFASSDDFVSFDDAAVAAEAFARTALRDAMKALGKRR